MENQKIVQALKDKLNQIDKLKNQNYDSQNFKVWENSIKAILSSSFGKNSKEYIDIISISFACAVMRNPSVDYTKEDQDAYIKGLNDAEALLKAVLEKIDLFGLKGKQVKDEHLGKNSVIQNFYMTQTQVQQLNQTINLESFDEETQQKVKELFNELEKKENKDKSKIKEIIIWLADRAIDILIAIISADKC